MYPEGESRYQPSQKANKRRDFIRHYQAVKEGKTHPDFENDLKRENLALFDRLGRFEKFLAPPNNTKPMEKSVQESSNQSESVQVSSSDNILNPESLFSSEQTSKSDSATIKSLKDKLDQSIVPDTWVPSKEAVRGRSGKGEIWGKEIEQAKAHDINMNREGVYLKRKGTDIVQYIPKIGEGIKETQCMKQAFGMMCKIKTSIGRDQLTSGIFDVFNSRRKGNEIGDWDIIKVNK